MNCGAPFSKNVFIFEQTPHVHARQISRVVETSGEPIMAIPKSDKHKDYVRYAAHCLDRVSETKDQAARAINREMAAEWLKLADATLHPLTPMK